MKKIATVILLLVVFSSCRKLPDFDNLSYNLVVITSRDTRVNFSDYQTYSLPTKIGLISDSRNDSVIPQDIANRLLQTIEANMNAKGFTKVLPSQNPDLGIGAVVLTKTNESTYVYAGDWWGYSGWYYPCDDWGYCGYYPSYPSYYTSYTYETGSLVVEIADLKNVPQGEDRLNMIWLNFNAGILGTRAENTTAGINAINTAFAQSTYLKR